MNQLVLSVTKCHVLSVTRSSWYRQPKYAANFCFEKAYGTLNFTNLDSFGILLTNSAFLRAVNKAATVSVRSTTAVTLPYQTVAARKLNHLQAKRTQKRSGVSAKDAPSLDWALAKVGRKERKGLPGLSDIVGSGCPAPHREARKYEGIACQIIVDAPPCTLSLTLSKRLASEVRRKVAVEISPNCFVVSCWADHWHQSRPAWRDRRCAVPENAIRLQDTAQSFPHELFQKARRFAR